MQTARFRPESPRRETAVNVGTQPRLVQHRSTPASSSGAASPAEPQPAPTGPLTILLVGVAALLGGVYLATGSQYHHIHRRIADEYSTYLDEWASQHHKTFLSSKWEAHVDGVAHPLRLHATYTPSKTVRARAHGNNHDGVANLPATMDVSRGRRAARRAHNLTLVHFAAPGLLQAVHPHRHSQREAVSLAHHPALWREVLPSFSQPRNVSLVVLDGATATQSRLQLQPIAFVRSRSVPMSGGVARCTRDHQGVWEEDFTCSVKDYLHSLCVKVRREASGEYVPDNSFGGPGCSASAQWSQAGWRRLPFQVRLHGEQYLPRSASNMTVIMVRHARDPSVLESELMHRLAPHAEQQLVLHAVGLALCFVAAVLLLTGVVLAAPAAQRWAGRALRRLRGLRNKQRDDHD